MPQRAQDRNPLVKSVLLCVVWAVCPSGFPHASVLSGRELLCRTLSAGHAWMRAVKCRTFFITGTDTGVGKTVLTVMLARHLREAGFSVAALKPLCSGGRDDARRLHAALGGALTLDEVNPWHFRAPVTPLLAARKAGVRVRLADVLDHVRAVQRRFELVLVEGAGGLLSPLGEHFNARDLIAALRAVPVVVCPNRLGAINQALLVLAALPENAARMARVVLASSRRSNAVGESNRELLIEFLGKDRLHLLPWLNLKQIAGQSPIPRTVRRTLQRLVLN